MLIITRRPGEKIMVGDDVVVEVIEVSGSSVRIGISDPSDAEVLVTVRAGESLDDFKANLRAPILIAGGRGHQVINQAPDAPVRAPLFAGLQEEPSTKAA